MFSPWPLQELFFAQTIAVCASPFIFLTPAGRLQIGLSDRDVAFITMLLSVVTGAACGFLFFAAGMRIYGLSPDNWCISVRNYLHLEEMRGLFPPLGLFALYALPAIFLAPIAEEILFRGLIQESFARRFNPTVATCVNSVLFGLLYLYLHGVWQDHRGFHIRLVSAALAALLMACIGGIFTLFRSRFGSLWPAMAAHAGFNLGLLAATIRQFAR